MEPRFTGKLDLQEDFAPRAAGGYRQHLLIFAAAAIILYGSAMLIPAYGQLVFILAVLFVTGGLAWYTVSYTQSQRDLTLLTEFQNAMFASAAGINTRFSLILRKDGRVVYYDRGFQQTFPQFSRSDCASLDRLIEKGFLVGEGAKTLRTALEQERKDQAITRLQVGGAEMTCILFLDPLPRPHHYFLLRGREFVERGSYASASITTFGQVTPTVPAMMRNLLQQLPVGLYVTDEQGALSFASHPLERLLGYDDGELTRLRPRLHNLVARLDESDFPDRMEEYEGQVYLRRQDDSLVRAYLQQQMVRDAHNEIVGLSGIIEVEIAPSEAKKKFRW